MDRLHVIEVLYHTYRCPYNGTPCVKKEVRDTDVWHGEVKFTAFRGSKFTVYSRGSAQLKNADLGGSNGKFSVLSRVADGARIFITGEHLNGKIGRALGANCVVDIRCSDSTIVISRLSRGTRVTVRGTGNKLVVRGMGSNSELYLERNGNEVQLKGTVAPTAKIFLKDASCTVKSRRRIPQGVILDPVMERVYRDLQPRPPRQLAGLDYS